MKLLTAANKLNQQLLRGGYEEQEPFVYALSSPGVSPVNWVDMSTLISQWPRVILEDMMLRDFEVLFPYRDLHLTLAGHPVASVRIKALIRFNFGIPTPGDRLRLSGSPVVLSTQSSPEYFENARILMITSFWEVVRRERARLEQRYRRCRGLTWSGLEFFSESIVDLEMAPDPSSIQFY